MVPCNTCFLQPARVHNPKSISIGLDVCAQLTTVLTGMPGHVLCPKNYPFNRVTLYFTMGHPFALNIAPFHGGIWTPFNNGSLGPPKSSTQMASRAVQLLFVGLTTVTDRPTYHITQLVTTDRIYVNSTAMQPNNNNDDDDKISVNNTKVSINMIAISKICGGISVIRVNVL